MLLPGVADLETLMPMLFYTPSAEQLQTQSRNNNQGRSGTPVSPEQYADSVARQMTESFIDAYPAKTSPSTGTTRAQSAGFGT